MNTGKHHSVVDDELDFSSLMNDAGHEQRADDPDLLTQYQQSLRNQNMSNSNLSNVINNIQDDGPARGQRNREQADQNSAARPGTVVTDDEAELSQASVSMHEQYIRERAALNELAEHKNRQLNPSKRILPKFVGNNRLQLLPMLLLLVVTTVMLMVNMRTESRLDLMAAALDQNSLDGTGSSLQAGYTTGFQDELQHINAELDALKQRLLEQNVDPAEQEDARQSLVSSVFASVMSALTQESDIQFGDYMHVQQKLDDIERRLNTDSIPMREKKIIATGKPAKVSKSAAVATPAHVWVVNIATLSDVQKARASVKTLRDAGYDASMQSLERSDSTLYRLSVGGFTSIAGAQAFVGIAASRFGFEGGWIQNG